MSDTVEGLPKAPEVGPITKGSSIRWVSRSNLPARSAKTDFNVWSFIKHCFGKDLTKISMPVILNEPLSFLQRVAEYMEYSELLEQACNLTDPACRLEYISAFAVSATSSNHNRMGKPFNPLLGETYELHHNGFVLVAEQVSHHPPVTAVHVQSENYHLWSTIRFKLRFWGKSLDVQPKGIVNLKLLKHNEIYTWHHPNLVVHNLLMGKMWLEHVGQMVVTNHTSGHLCELDFQPMNWTNQQANQVIGRLLSPDGTVLRHVFGNWTRGLFSVDPQIWANSTPNRARRRSDSLNLQHIDVKKDTPRCANDSTHSSNSSAPGDLHLSQLGFDLILPEQKCLWRANPRPEQAADYYSFTQYAIGLNELNTDLAEAQFVTNSPSNGINNTPYSSSSFLPPTDCRFRPDIRALELGELDLASSEKDRLEEKQRQALKSSGRRTSNSSPTKTTGKNDFNQSTALNGTQIGPVWFRRNTNQMADQDEWIFTNEYWSRDWSKCPNLY